MDSVWMWLHLVAAAFWLGGLLMLAAVTMSAVRILDRPTFRALIGHVGRTFFAGSLIAWALLGISGTALAAGRLHTLNDLTTTSFGRTLCAKTGVFLLAIIATVAHTLTGGSRAPQAIKVSRMLSPVIFLLTLAIFYLAVRLAGG